jgi:hypothetical protein
MMEHKEQQNIKWYSLQWENPRLPLLIFLSVGVLWLINLSLLFYKERGLFGDMFGAVNSLFSGLAFAGIIYSIRLQQKELSTQQEIMKQQKAEFAIQSREFTKQNEVLKIQQLENTFLNLLSSHHSFVKGLIIYDHIGAELEGKDVFKYISNYIRAFLNKGQGVKNFNQEVVQKFEIITTYISSLDVLLQFLERADIKKADKLFYGSVLKSQIEKQEFYFITRFITSYNASSPYELELITRLKKYFLPDPEIGG